MSDHLNISQNQPVSSAAAFNNDQSLLKSNELNEQRILPIQCKLTVGAVDDPLEHEADAMADRVMRMPQENFIQRKCAHCKKAEKEEELHRKPLSSFIQKKGSTTGTGISETVSSRINSSKGNGSSMDASTKTFMENSFGADFNDVNIHTGSEASLLNRELNARAFAIGNDIYFNEGQYNPASDEGKHLLAHELTHTLQQTGTIQRDPNTPTGTYPDLELDPSLAELSITRVQRGVGDFRFSAGLLNPAGLIPPSLGVPADPSQPGYTFGFRYSDRCERALQGISLDYTRDLFRGPNGQISQSSHWTLGGGLSFRAFGRRINLGANASFQNSSFDGLGLSLSTTPESTPPIPNECLSQPHQPDDGTGTDNTRPPGGNTGNNFNSLCGNVNCNDETLTGRARWLQFLCCLPRTGNGNTNDTGGGSSAPELTMPTIYFYYDTSVSKPESNGSLARLLQTMQMFPSVHVQVSGHTSLEGRERYNQGLSQRRAESVKRYFELGGVASSRITVLALGETAPAVTEPLPEPSSTGLRLPEGEAIRDLNRRAEIALFDPSGQSPYFPLTPPFVLSTRGLSVRPPSRLERGGLLGSPLLRW